MMMSSVPSPMYMDRAYPPQRVCTLIDSQSAATESN
jgi:hypothetical protein